MNVSKCVNCFPRKCFKYFIHNNDMKVLSRSYSSVLMRRFKSPSAFIEVEKSLECFIPKHSHLSFHRSYSQQAPEMHPLKFDDMSFEPPVSHEDLLAALQKCQSLSDQMETLVTTLALSPEDVQERIKFCKTLETLFHPFFKDFKIQMFGSTVNCFGFKGCDIDMTFETSIGKKKVFFLEVPGVPLVNEVLSGKVSLQELSDLPITEQLVFIKTVLQEYYKETSSQILFISAHVPLVRFHHDKFNLKCDLTFKNLVAYKNTKLMYLFGKLDKRVVPLMMTFRYWAKYIELVSKGLSFNTYTISLMVIYFLQTRNPPILPSAEYIMSLSDCFENEDMNDKSFLDILNKIPPSQNTQSLDELLKELFFFYAYFDFTRVICPLTAKSIPKEEFKSAEANGEFEVNATICVQDPMCPSHNVANRVDFQSCKKLFRALMITFKIFQDEYSFVPSTNPWGLMTILDKPNEYSPMHVAMPKYVSFEIPSILNIQNNDISKHQITSIYADTLFKTLHHGLLFECRPLEVDKIRKILQEQDAWVVRQKKESDDILNAKLELQKLGKKLKKNPYEYLSQISAEEMCMLDQFEKINIKNDLVLCVECKTSKVTWMGRDFIDIDTVADSSNNILDREHLISVYAANMTENIEEEKKMKFLFECYTSKSTSDPSLVVYLRPILTLPKYPSKCKLQKMYFNPFLFTFLKEYVPKLMKRINERN